MAHQFSSGAFFNGQAAWHGLGTVLDGTLPAREAFALADADWSVLSTPIFDPAGQPIDGYQALLIKDAMVRLEEAIAEATISPEEG